MVKNNIISLCMLFGFGAVMASQKTIVNVKFKPIFVLFEGGNLTGYKVQEQNNKAHSPKVKSFAPANDYVDYVPDVSNLNDLIKKCSCEKIFINVSSTIRKTNDYIDCYVYIKEGNKDSVEKSLDKKFISTGIAPITTLLKDQTFSGETALLEYLGKNHLAMTPDKFFEQYRDVPSKNSQSKTEASVFPFEAAFQEEQSDEATNESQISHVSKVKGNEAQVEDENARDDLNGVDLFDGQVSLPNNLGTENEKNVVDQSQQVNVPKGRQNQNPESAILPIDKANMDVINNTFSNFFKNGMFHKEIIQTNALNEEYAPWKGIMDEFKKENEKKQVTKQSDKSALTNSYFNKSLLLGVATVAVLGIGGWLYSRYAAK